MPQSNGYHHGDLRAACLRAARELLEEDGGAGLSLRAVARRAGVSATAPYRHFADRDALVSGVAAQGYRELAGKLAGARPSPPAPDDLAALAVVYVRFALEHPALFRAMFAEPCDPADEERAAAAAVLSEYVQDVVRTAFPGTGDPAARATAVWALVHGLAFLHLDGKLDSSTPQAVDDQVRAAVRALLAPPPAAPRTTTAPAPGTTA
ncbi:TetR/AcrR family transcriptional regulator [Streptomyces sp. NPDC092952]|uniref:TetR/AcrR family transcriptional regulator n=1 Tax=Streptomyces sp. NPDC092952 TaxID=3366018 RepID=UPI0037F3A898